MAYGKNAYRGKFKPQNPQKYKGDVNNIVYRSSWELKAFSWCDKNPSIIKWASEEVVIPYISPIDNRQHRYFIDLYMEVRDVNGKIKRYLVEIKPKKYTEPPAQSARKTKQYIQEVVQYSVNMAKWNAAREVCKDNNVEFIILTEDHLNIK